MREYAGNALAFESGSYRAQRMPSHSSSEYSVRRILLVENEKAQQLLYERELREDDSSCVHWPLLSYPG